MTELDKIKKLLTIVEKLKVQYESELKQNNQEKAEQIKRVLINTIVEIKKKEKILAKKKDVAEISGNSIINEFRAENEYKKNSHAIKEKKKRKLKFGSFLIAIIVTILALIFSLGNYSLYNQIFSVQDNPTLIAQGKQLHSLLSQISVIIVSIIFLIYQINIKKENNSNLILFFIGTGLVLTYLTSGTNKVLDFIPDYISNNQSLNLISGILIFIGLVFLYAKSFDFEIKLEKKSDNKKEKQEKKS